MTTLAPPVIETSAAPSPPPAQWFWRCVLAPIKLFWGAIFCQSLLGSLLIVGWTQRFGQRTVLKRWWAASKKKNESFENFLSNDRRTREHLHWPNWFVQQPLPAADASFFARVFALAGSLVRNSKLGWQGILNTWLLTLPAGALWLFAWHFGWDNSFNKGYEQFWVGPALGWMGIMAFIAVMFYLPMAQARQSATGHWKSFFQFALIWRLVRQRWIANLGLAILYAAVSMPLMLLTFMPIFFPNISPKLEGAPPAQAIAALNAFYFWAAFFVFPAFVFLRWVAARIYAGAVLQAVQGGGLAHDALDEFEWRTLHRLELLAIQPSRPRHFLVRLAAWAATRAGRIAAGFFTFLVWFGFVVQIFIGAFFSYRGPATWLNQPLVQLPWFHHIPARLKNPGPEILFAGMVLLAIWAIPAVIRSFPRPGARPAGIDAS
jgi:hypothetical protein